MLRKIFTGIAFAGCLVSSFANPVSISSSPEHYGVYSGIAYIERGSDQIADDGTDRYNPLNMFDSDINTFYSLGMGGIVQIDLTDPQYFVDNSTVIEVTYNNLGDQNNTQQHYEAAEVYWGNKDGYVGNALLLNGSYFSTIVNGLKTGAYNGWNVLDQSVSVSNTNDVITYQIAVPKDANYTSLYIVDATEKVFGSSSHSVDGFDIGKITYKTVPEPASLTLLGVSILSLLGFSFRRKK
jgi:hypothetical protein